MNNTHHNSRSSDPNESARNKGALSDSSCLPTESCPATAGGVSSTELHGQPSGSPSGIAPAAESPQHSATGSRPSATGGSGLPMVEGSGLPMVEGPGLPEVTGPGQPASAAAGLTASTATQEISASEAAVLYLSHAAVQKTAPADGFESPTDPAAGVIPYVSTGISSGNTAAIPADPSDDGTVSDESAKPKPYVCQITSVPLSHLYLLNGRKLGRFIVNPYSDTADTVDSKGVVLIKTGTVFRMVRPFDGVIAGEPLLRSNLIKAKVYTFPDDITPRIVDAALKLSNPSCHFIETAKLYSFLIRRAGLSQKDLMSWFNLSQSTVSNRLRLLSIDPTVLKEARANGLSERHCRALLHVDGPEMQMYVMNILLTTKVGTQRAEQLVKPLTGKTVSALGKTKYIDLINSAFCDIEGYLSKERKSFISTLSREVNTLRKLGISASLSKFEKDEFTEITIRIKKDDSYSSKPTFTPSDDVSEKP